MLTWQLQCGEAILDSGGAGIFLPLLLGQVAMDLRHHGRTFAGCRGDALGRGGAQVAHGEYARHACFKVAFAMPAGRFIAGEHEAGVTQFLVADPDGYLIRFQASLGRRPFAPEPG